MQQRPRVLLLTDAFTYSAADIFAAGFADHDIGFVYRVDGGTGGGRANGNSNVLRRPCHLDAGGR